MAEMTPMMKQYLAIKQQYKDDILFFRLGDFYEMFFDDAKIASRELELTLTGKDCGLEERAPMCGVPYHAASVYISRLIEKGHKVAICEQMTDPSLSKGLVEREVVRATMLLRLATLAVLGPEAPLMAIGTALGALAFRDPTKPVRTVMMLAGAMAAIGAIFGNPLVTAILLLEIAIVGGARLANPGVLLAALSALASGYTLQVGIEGWSGLGRAQLAVPGLPSYPSVHTTDVLLAVPLALIVAAISMAARIGGERIYLRAQRQPLATILVSAVVIGLSAVAVAAITGGGLDLVLFSGQDAMPDYLAITSLGTALVILAGKFVAYTFSLGSGFRGGPIFPAVALGTILATGCALLVHGSSLSALSATCIAAAVAAALRMPFTAALLAVLLTASAGGATTVLAIVGAVVGMLARLAAEVRLDVLAAPRKL